MKNYRSNGKLLMSAEYLVLDGAEALAVPTKKGQTLTVFNNFNGFLYWKSFTVGGSIWFEAEFDSNLKPITTTNNEVSTTLSIFLQVALMLNPDFLSELKGCNVETHLEFEQNWGLGSSSTLIANISKWANVDPFVLQQETFPGSGYDIACALTDKPIIYQLFERDPSYATVRFNPFFADNIFFVHLNKKQNSRDGIKKYREFTNDKTEYIKKISDISYSMANCIDLKEFRKLIGQHESIIAEVTQQKTVKELLFPDFKGSVKSLGAWGGDFVMAVGDNVESYFMKKGYKTILSYSEMVK
ncbi:MAG: GHMP kinase [Ichthyobacteriaceae bacterium]|nr:GHMP kinase [Ichthyobacteriaceae bacterium]